ncbi:hypothetical protein ACQRXC_28990 (plasmid) [Niallia taxi]|uniref:hypothetical protein n=1 Tax=Niallia taxi TaxID=2499688 RepID=UPI003F5F5B5D
MTKFLFSNESGTLIFDRLEAIEVCEDYTGIVLYELSKLTDYTLLILLRAQGLVVDLVAEDIAKMILAQETEVQREIKLERIIDDSILSFKGWEFETKEAIYIAESDMEVDLFRLEYNKTNRSYRIFVANHEEYCIHEDVTYLFNLVQIINQCKKQETADIDNQIKYYLEYVLSEGGLGE